MIQAVSIILLIVVKGSWLKIRVTPERRVGIELTKATLEIVRVPAVAIHDRRSILVARFRDFRMLIQLMSNGIAVMNVGITGFGIESTSTRRIMRSCADVAQYWRIILPISVQDLEICIELSLDRFTVVELTAALFRGM